jgi:hypothetical protein
MPKSEDVLKQITACEEGVNELFGRANTTSFLNQGSLLRERLEICAADLRLLREEGNSDPEIATAEKLAKLLLHRLESLTTANVLCRDNAKLLFQEAGQWARHFSTVRMTVITFTITTCTAIIAWKWGKREVDNAMVANSAAFLWVLGVTVFWIFTIATYREVDKQRKVLPLFLNKTIKRKQSRFDWASLVISVLCVAAAFVPAIWRDVAISWLLRIPVITAAVVGIVFCFKYRKWAKR